MNNTQRLANLVLGFLMIACGIVLLLNPQGGVIVVAAILSAILLLYGVGKLVYYISLARHMTGGLTVLFMAIIAIDVGAFAVAVVVDNPLLAIAFYLSTYNTISGFLSIARGIESKLFGSPWIMNILLGLVSLALASLCTTFINSGETIIWVFCIGLFYSAGVRLASAFKPTEIIYIQ